MSRPPAIELRGVIKCFGPVRALALTDLTVGAGQTTVLIGPSGCGKSTLLRLMLGLIQPDHGEVRIGDAVLTREGGRDSRRRMGYVIQDGGLFPHLSARDNVSLLVRYLGWSPDQVGSRLSELCELTRFPRDALDRFPVQLSGGQRQRVALMRALMPEPDVLLLDEPLGALDPMVRAELQRDLRDIFRALGKTVVMVTHQLAEAAFFADLVVLMCDGRIVQTSRGGLAEFTRGPAEPFVTRFLSAQRAVLSVEQEWA
jgi:osmoprotectant transport system ATP-binding protein